ncbi:DUF3048 domain-containing protein [Streptomyces sp. NPDC088354]|uniref:DUF3048 domain-containing protein n=1 Tax=unclassified Streptomyces TaxID=2593676 RepID=UPI0029BB71C2|nr:DUF3048 domain-containing protein [Streptomyces sp. MI02-7b]MDX3077147.1 DUF3048 domain-containing protein [Streptomyces sp. MI02-7b]
MDRGGRRATNTTVVAVLAALAVLVAGLLFARNGGADRTSNAPRPSTPPAAAPSVSPAPSASPLGERSPFTGLPQDRPRPVLAVKIDNVGPARPQTGIDRADLVYVEQVEAGLTRILAVFSSSPSHLPDRVGPVRSARESDLELLRQFGRPALAFSGAQTRLLPVIAAAPLYDVSPGRAGGGYTRDGSRPAPHNLYASPARLLAAAPDASASRDIGFRFGPAPSGGTAAATRTVRFPSASVGLRWSAEQRRWLVSFDGRPATATGSGRLGAPTVVIQYVTVRASRYHDRWGSISPYSETVGSGEAEVLRDGAAYRAHWSRPDASRGTRFTTAQGAPMTFAPGQVWIVLAPRPA